MINCTIFRASAKVTVIRVEVGHETVAGGLRDAYFVIASYILSIFIIIIS